MIPKKVLLIKSKKRKKSKRRSKRRSKVSNKPVSIKKSNNRKSNNRRSKSKIRNSSKINRSKRRSSSKSYRKKSKTRKYKLAKIIKKMSAKKNKGKEPIFNGVKSKTKSSKKTSNKYTKSSKGSKNTSKKTSRKSKLMKSKNLGGRPPKSRRQALEDLIQRCRERNIETKNKRTGKMLSEETLRHRCTYRNAPSWGGKGDPEVPLIYRKPRRKKRKGVPFKKAPRILPSTIKPRKESLPEAVTVDRNIASTSRSPMTPIRTINRRRSVQPTLIIREYGSNELDGKFGGRAKVVRIPNNLTRSERHQLIRSLQNM